MQQETIIIGDREFTCVRMNAFAANTLVLRLQKVVVPVFGAIVGKGGSMKDIGNMDVKVAAGVIAEHLDESLMVNIVLPLFAESRLHSLSNKKFIKTPADIDACFTSENLFELYELIWEVGKFQFAPFFAKIAERFGVQIDAASKAQQFQAS